MIRDLSRLLRPQTIALFGGRWAAAVALQLAKSGYEGAVWPVHPDKPVVEGLHTYRSIAELPGAPDAAFVGVNRAMSVEIVRELAACGAGGAVCYAAGFREAGGEGEALQRALVEAAGDMPILGPNCYGFINYCNGALLWPDQHGGVRLDDGERGAAIVTQSSNIAINMTMQKRGLPLAYVMTAGNQAQTGLSEMALGLIEDQRVSALGLHIEGIDSVAGFERLAARACVLKKPIVAMKVGRSEQARAATISHTASLAGSAAASDAFFARLGIAQVSTIPAFLEALKLLAIAGPLPGSAMSSMSCSGGEASVMADSATGRKVHFPPLEHDHAAKVFATLGPLVAVANPLDYHTFIWNDRPAMERTFDTFVSGGFDFNFLVMDFPRGDRCSDADWWSAVAAFELALKNNAAKGAILASMPENLPENYCHGLRKRGVVPMQGIAEAMEAVEAAAMIGAAWADASTEPILQGRLRSGGALITLDEAEAKMLLRQSGLPVPPGRRVSSVDEAVAAAQELGFPVALKALGIAHKSEQGAVRLNLGGADAVRAAAADLRLIASELYVERMVIGGVAELIAGVVNDAVFGPVLTIGTGGVLVELLDDSQTLLLPANRFEIEQALRRLRFFPLLDGYRGGKKADIAAAVDVVFKIAGFAASQAPNLVEMDINPLIVCAEGEGAWIADALIVMREEY